MPILAPVGAAILGSGLQLEINRSQKQRLPGIKPGDLLRAALDIQSLSEEGLQPRATTDPFTGNLVISTADQEANLQGILADQRLRELLAPTPEETETSARNRLVVLSLIPGTRGATGRQIAPGIVRRGEPTPGRQTSGPCAGGLSRLSQIRCNVGGFA